jgi:hypothetical protein
VVKWTLESFEAFWFLTGLSLINHWVELLLFPSMAEVAYLKSLAAFFVASDESATLPILTKLGVISEKVGFSPEILKVMRIYALRFVVIMVIRTPFCFEEKNVKVKILVCGQQMVNQAHLNIFNGVCERTIFSIFTLLCFVGKTMAKLCLILVLVIKSLNSVMGSPTFVLLWALLRLRKFTKLRSINVIISALVFN